MVDFLKIGKIMVLNTSVLFFAFKFTFDSNCLHYECKALNIR